MLLHKESVQKLLIQPFKNANLPNEICQKIVKNIKYDCTCNNNIVCLMCTHACCPKAKQRWCVCTVSFECPDHGYRCVGSHD